MTDTPQPLTPRAEAYLAQVDASLACQPPADIADRVEHIVASHDAWRSGCLNLNPAESGLSLRAQAILASDMATRLSEGPPGDREYPHGNQNRFADELEAIVISLARRQFGAKFVDWRPVSTSMANAAVFFAMLRPGDAMLVQGADGGGNFSYHARGPAGLVTNLIIEAPCNETFEPDLDAWAKLAEREQPKLIVVGGSNVLFPYPVRDLRRIADRVGATLLYDAAHLGLLVSAGDFQRPLEEGAHVMTISTHKIMGGPVGGMALTNDPAIAGKLLRLTFPAFLQTRDQNKYAALAIALAENQQFGRQLARDMVANAQALAGALQERGFDVVGGARGHTAAHQLFLRLGANARSFELACQSANILLADSTLPGDGGARAGARLATHEITRMGFGVDAMGQVADLIHRAHRGEDPAAVASDVAALLGHHRETSPSLCPRPQCD